MLCQTNLISYFDRVAAFVDKSKGVDMVYLDFTDVFDISHMTFWKAS